MRKDKQTTTKSSGFGKKLEDKWWWRPLGAPLLVYVLGGVVLAALVLFFGLRLQEGEDSSGPSGSTTHIHIHFDGPAPQRLNIKQLDRPEEGAIELEAEATGSNLRLGDIGALIVGDSAPRVLKQGHELPGGGQVGPDNPAHVTLSRALAEDRDLEGLFIEVIRDRIEVTWLVLDCYNRLLLDGAIVYFTVPESETPDNRFTGTCTTGTLGLARCGIDTKWVGARVEYYIERPGYERRTGWFVLGTDSKVRDCLFPAITNDRR